MISIDEYVSWVGELIETISTSIATCNHCSFSVTNSISSHLMFSFVTDIEIPVLIHVELTLEHCGVRVVPDGHKHAM